MAISNQQTRLLRFARNDNSQGGRSTLRPYYSSRVKLQESLTYNTKSGFPPPRE